MKSLKLFLHEVLRETGDWCHVSTTRDEKTITSRIEGEGLQFLTITLPNYGKDFERSLDQGYVGPSAFIGFPRKGKTPIFLGGFMDLVFDRGTGALLDDPSIIAIRALRQITLMWAKIKLPLSKKREQAAFDAYVQCEQDLQEVSFPDGTLDALLRNGIPLWANVLSGVTNDIYHERILPKHGPGSTAERRLGNKKYEQFEWTERLDQVFPASSFLHYKWVSPECDDSVIKILEPGSERPVRVIGVPKTQKTLRIISIEPTAMQYVQQGLLESFTKNLEADSFANGLIGWSSQIPNQEKARHGSLSGELATLDLSEASDRVLWSVVQALLRPWPLLLEAVDACRSRTASVQGHPGTIPLIKFASMGSALTFPIEAMVFATIISLAIESELGPVGNRLKPSLRRVLASVRVYGDDLIVPVEYVDSVISHLELFGLKVNRSKSFWTGKFRESCGKEYYNGHDVSITRVRSDLPTSRKHAREIVATTSLRNQLFMAGYRTSVSWLDELIGGLIPFPEVGESSPALGRHTIGPVDKTDTKWDPDTQKLLVRAMVVKVRRRPDKLGGDGALMKFFLKRGTEPQFDRDHLLYAGRPESVDIKTRWTPLI